jgi:hypothetical protein
MPLLRLGFHQFIWPALSCQEPDELPLSRQLIGRKPVLSYIPPSKLPMTQPSTRLTAKATCPIKQGHPHADIYLTEASENAASTQRPQAECKIDS